MESIKEGQTVLLIWSGISPPQDLEQIVGRMTQLAGSTGKINVEHIDRLKLCMLLLNLIKFITLLFLKYCKILGNVRLAYKVHQHVFIKHGMYSTSTLNDQNGN